MDAGEQGSVTAWPLAAHRRCHHLNVVGGTESRGGQPCGRPFLAGHSEPVIVKLSVVGISVLSLVVIYLVSSGE